MNKTILITGSSRGIGITTAKLFIEKGWNVIATMRNPDEETELNQFSNVLVTHLDVTNEKSISTAINEGIIRFGKIDAILNNAGYGQFGLFEATDSAQILEQFNVNVFGTINVIRAILPHFRSNKSGTIINVSSGAGRVGMPMVSLYASSKFAVEGFSESLYYELFSQNIKVKLIEPGGVDTTFHDEAQRRFALDQNLIEYDEFVQKFMKKFESMHDGIASSQQVADAIYEAATDDSNQLRYTIGNDIETWLKYRVGGNEEDYISFMSELYQLK